MKVESNRKSINNKIVVMIKIFKISFFLFIGTCLTAQEKIPITSADDLPVHYYELEDNTAMNYVNDLDLCVRLAEKIEKNLKDDLEKYDIRDKSTLREYHDMLSTIAFLKGDYETSLKHVKKGRALTEKESSKYLWNLNHEAYLVAKMFSCPGDEEVMKKNMAAYLTLSMEVAPYEAIKEDVESAVGMLEILTESLFIGVAEGQLQPLLDKTEGKLHQALAAELLELQRTFTVDLPYIKEVYLPVNQAIYGKNHVEVEMVDIWQERDVIYKDEKNLNSVNIAVWDTGVDMSVFSENNKWVNSREKLDGKDNDGNGFIDDVNGIAYDKEVYPVTEVLMPAEKIHPEIHNYEKYMKGIGDLQAAINSEEADEVKKYIASLKPEEVGPFLENAELYGLYSHGTHVAGIAAKGNPAGKIMAARVSWTHKSIPDLLSMEKSKRWAKLYENTINYFKENNVRIVNMSWGYTLQGYEYDLSVHGIGETDDERKTIAKELFNIEKDAFYNAMKNAPEILFVTAAGNSNDDMDFSTAIPQGFDLPNIIQIGAVDIEGKETGFTTTGKGVDVYANGYEVESYVPGGAIHKSSGTSMSSPQVANLAGKIWAKYPNLSVQQVKGLIIDGATPSAANPEILLIHPKRSLDMAAQLNP